jgi:hypothetical protein
LQSLRQLSLQLITGAESHMASLDFRRARSVELINCPRRRAQHDHADPELYVATDCIEPNRRVGQQQPDQLIAEVSNATGTATAGPSCDANTHGVPLASQSNALED